MYQKTVGDAIQKRRTKLWIRYILALVLTIVMLVMLSADYSERAVSQRIIVGWAVCLTAFILADILAGSLEGGLWAGYIYFATVVAWLILGLGGALVVVILGTSVGILARSNLSASPYVPPINDANFLETAAGRIAVTGSAVTVAALLYALFGGDAPIMDTELRVAPLAVALLVGLVVTQFVAGMLVFGDVVPKPIWEPGERGRLAAELILLLLVVPITLIFAAEDLSVLMFVIAMVGVFIQAVRYRQIHLTQDDLRARVQELSMLNAIAQNVSSNLDIENVLESIYQWVDEYATPGLFYIGLYDEDRGLIEFPLVIVGGEKAKWKTQSLEENAINNHVILNKSILKITRETRPEFETLFAGLPEDANHQVGLGIPLVVNTKIIGLIGIVSGSDWILNTGVVETVANQAGLAIRNATLYDRTVQLAENLAQINRSVQDVMFNLDSDEAMLSACKVAMDVVSAQKAAIFLLDQDVDDGLVLAQHIGLSSQHIELYSDPAYVPDLQEPLEVVVPNVDLVKEGEARIKALSEAGEFVAYAEIPLRSGNAAIGKLVVFHEQPYGYLRTQIELLESLAYQVTAALDNAELLSALEVYASEQAQLVHLSSVSTSSLDLERVIDRAAAMLQQMMSVDRITIGLLAQGNTVLQLYQDDDDDKNVLALAEVDELAQMSAEEQTTARVYHRGDATISAGLARLMERRGDYVLAVVPMVTNNEVIGVIMLGDAIFREFSDSEWRFIEMATNQITTQIHNAQLYRETQEALHRRLQQLALLEGIAQQISRSLNLDVLIHNVLEAVIRATQAGVAAIGLYTDSGQFQLYRREWLDGELVNRDLLLTEPEGLLSEVIKSSEPLIIPDNRAMAGYKTYHQKSVYRSSVIVPLLTEEGAIGVLNVESQKLDFFNDERVNFIKNLAGHATISIQNARLLQERQAQIETLTWLRDLSLGLSSNVTPDSVYGEILRTALGVVQGHSAQLWGYGPRTNELRVLASMASVDGDYVKMEIEIPAALAQQVVETGQIQLVFDVRTHPAFAGVDGWDKINYGSAIAAPIERGGSVREVLCITFKQPRPRLESEMGKIQLLAYQISGHLENLHLYDQIRSNNNRMRAILDSTRDGILLLDRRGRLVEGNLSAEALLNFSLEEHIGEEFARSLYMIAHREDQVDLRDKGMESLARHLRLNPRTISSHSFKIRSGGQVRHIEEVESPVLGNGNQVIGRLLTFRDATEEMLLNEYREEVMHMLVHDLREPLSSVIGSINFVQDILSAEGTPDPAIEQLLGVSMSSATRLYNLVETILDIYKMENRRMPLNRAEISIADVIDATISKLSASITEAQVTVSRDIPPDVPSVNIDADIIHRVLTNLLGNALRFTPTGGEVRFVVTPNDVQRQVTVRVADSGEGIPPEEAERIFEKFRQVEGSVPLRGHKGSGMGLAFCKTAIEAHEQKIWIEQSGPLPGACFAFTLPYAPAS